MQDSPDEVLASTRRASDATHLERRACDLPGRVDVDLPDFETACRHLERLLVLARADGDPLHAAAVCSQIGALFNAMGCHADAMAAIDRSLDVAIDHPEGGRLRFVNAIHGLFSAYRLRDEQAGLRFMALGTAALDDPRIDAAGRTAFEVHRAQFLLAHDDAETAELLIEAALHRCDTRDEAVRIPLEVAASLCDWASQVLTRQDAARRKLRDLYHRSRRTGLHHGAVLRASLQVYGRPTSREDVEARATYAKEWVAHRVGIARDRFDRQVADRQGRAGNRTAPRTGAPRTAACEVAQNWAVAAAFGDDASGERGFRVGRLAGLLAAEIGMDADDCMHLAHAARLHDIGRIVMDDPALATRGALDPAGLAALHAAAGGALLECAGDPTLRKAAVIARHHAQWWNGTGRPDGLAGERIPLEARICKLAAAYDALTTPQPRKLAWPHRTAVEQLMCEAGVRLDPQLMPPFLRVLARHVGSSATPPSGRAHPADVNDNGLIVARRDLLLTLHRQGSDHQGRSGR